MSSSKRRRLCKTPDPVVPAGAVPSVQVGGPVGESASALIQAKSVVEVIATHAMPQFPYPYAQPLQAYGNSTAFAIRDSAGQLCLICTHHGVQYASCVQVKRSDQDQRYDAKVLVHGYECDLALLAVAEQAFWEGLTAFELSMDFPRLLTTVTVLGFSEGGTDLCTTQGVVSRLDVLPYFGFVNLPVIQIDAAVNSGSSGGPALCGGKVLGMAFSGLVHAQNVGYLIPSKIIARFLKDFRTRGRYTQFGFPPFTYQNLESPDVRNYFGVDGRHSGIRVERVHGSAKGKLLTNDIILSIDGHGVGHDGKVPLGNDQETRVSLWLLFCEKLTGETCTIRVRRSAKERDVKIKLRPYRPVVPEDPYCVYGLDYFIIGGLVLQHVSMSYMISADRNAVKPLKVEIGKTSSWTQQEQQGKGLIVLGDVLQHPINVGVSYYTLLKTFNDRKFHSLKDLARAVDTCKDPWMRFKFDNGSLCVMQTKSARNATKELLAKFGLSGDRRLDGKKR